MNKSIRIKPDPNFERFRKATLRESESDRVPFCDVYVDVPVMETLLNEKIPSAPVTREEWDIYLKNRINFFYRYGYD